MKKTPVASRFLQQLNHVNDQICFSALQQWEFAQLLEPLQESSSNKFSISVFPQNPYAEKIHRRVSELSDLTGTAEVTALQTGVVASVEHLLAYMQEVQNLRENLITDTREEIRDDAEEEQLRLKLASWSGSPPTSEYFKTLGYFRHLRNHYAHVNLQPVSSFATYIRSHGSPLNTFWNNGVTTLYGLDFKSLPNNKLTPELTFGVINLLRICLREVDNMVAATVKADEAVRWVTKQIKSHPKNRNIASHRLRSKVIRRLENDWGCKANSSEIELAIALSASP